MEYKMPFVMSNMFLEKFKTLKTDYELKRGSSLTTHSSPSYMSRFFGATDVTARAKQFDFLLSIFNELKPHMFKENKSDTLEQHVQRHVLSLRILLVACLHVKTQIIQTYAVKHPNSLMIILIDNALGITPNNPIDDYTKKLCLNSTEKWLKCGDPSELDPLFSKPFTFLEKTQLATFEAFVKYEIKRLTDAEPATAYPIARTLQPLLAAPFVLAGSQLGSMLGASLAEKNTFAASLILSSLSKNGLLLSAMPATYIGAVILVPTITARLLNTFYGVSFSWALGNGLGLVGEGIGFGVGMSLDLSVIAIKNICRSINLLGDEYKNTSERPSGLRLTDGQIIVCGIDLSALNSITFAAENSDLNVNRLIQSSLTIEEAVKDGDDKECWQLLALRPKICKME